MSPSNAEIADAIKAHHLQMTTKLKGLTEDLMKNGIPDQDKSNNIISCRDDELPESSDTSVNPSNEKYTDTIEHIIEFLNFELKPHAKAEELYLYPVANGIQRLIDLISSMLEEHRLFENLIGRLTTKSLKKVSDIELIATCYDLSVLFELHASKENDFIVTEMSKDSSIEFGDILHQMHKFISEYSSSLTDNRLDVRTMAPASRHESIFSRFEQLKTGQQFLLVNDHDPKPLYYQFKAEYPDQFEWEYLMSGPSTWQVKIQKV